MTTAVLISLDSLLALTAAKSMPRQPQLLSMGIPRDSPLQKDTLPIFTRQEHAQCTSATQQPDVDVHAHTYDVLAIKIPTIMMIRNNVLAKSAATTMTANPCTSTRP